MRICIVISNSQPLSSIITILAGREHCCHFKALLCCVCRQVRKQTCDLITLLETSLPMSHYYLFMEDDFRCLLSVHSSITQVTEIRNSCMLANLHRLNVDYQICIHQVVPKWGAHNSLSCCQIECGSWNAAVAECALKLWHERHSAAQRTSVKPLTIPTASVKTSSNKFESCCHLV